MFKRCIRCFVPESRPRVTFNELGVCNACQWAEEKKSIDWAARQKVFGQICDRFRGNGREPDCIVPWSGGKDSIYVAYKMAAGFGMTPLLLTVMPHLETNIGKWNRENTCTKFDKDEIILDDEKYRRLAKKYFIEQGRPKHPWECAISASIINASVQLHLPFIIYGEEGEQEYGGVSREAGKWPLPVDKEYLMKYYWQGNLDWEIPSETQFEDIFFTQWSRFEDWRPSDHAKFAIEKGMKIRDKRNIGTYTMDSQLSDKLQDLHVFLMYLKYGFGRCTSDCCIAIREGKMNRRDADLLIGLYDGEYPQKYEKEYLEYFDMSRREYMKVLKSFYEEINHETR
jgi:N-acetyl sugar amidotransferase